MFFFEIDDLRYFDVLLWYKIICVRNFKEKKNRCIIKIIIIYIYISVYVDVLIIDKFLE